MPVDIAFGTVSLDYEDLVLPGRVPLIWDRRYSTAHLDRGTALGQAWTSRYFASLSYADEQFRFVTPQGGTEAFANPDGGFARGWVLRNLSAFMEVFRREDEAIVQTWDVETSDVLRYCFVHGEPGQPWRLGSIEDVSGHGVDLQWSADGRLQSVRQRVEQRAIELEYDRRGLITEVRLVSAEGDRFHVMSYAYDDQGRIAEARDAAGFADRFEYDSAGRLVREIVKDGGVYHHRYDPQGRCVLRTGLGHQNEKRLRFVDAVRITEVTNSLGDTWTYQHLPSGQAVLEVDPLGARRTTGYDEHGRVVSKTDAMGATTRYGYDDAGNRTLEIDALGHATRYLFDDQHQPIRMTDALGGVWDRELDERHRIVATSDPDGSVWRYTYDAEGNVAQVTDALGGQVRQHYRQGLLRAVTDRRGATTSYEFDAFGRVTARHGPMDDHTTIRYDVMGNPVQVVLPDGTGMAATYDHAGNLTRLIDADGQVTRWRYGPCSRLLERVDPSGGRIQYHWSTERSILDAVVNEKGERYGFVRDAVGRIVEETGFDGALRKFVLNAEGRCVQFTNANGESIALARDALQRIVMQTLPDGSRSRFVFDAVGNLSAADNDAASVVLVRDAVGRITKETAGGHTVLTAYDAVGNVTRTASDLGHDVAYGYDAGGQASRVQVQGHDPIEFRRNAYGQDVSRGMPGGLRLEQRYDVMGRLTDQTMVDMRAWRNATDTAGGGLLVRRAYAFDATGRVASIDDRRWGRIAYAYDPAERLVETLRDRGLSERFDYDAASNVVRRRAESTHQLDETADIDAGNRLARLGDARYEYDAEGRRIAQVVPGADGQAHRWQYRWNVLDRLTAVVLPDGSSVEYRYDALGRRIGKCRRDADGVRVGTRCFLWDQYSVRHEWAEDQPDSASLWLFDGVTPLATVNDRRLYSVITDHLGSPRELVRDDGVLYHLNPRTAWGQRIGGQVQPDVDALCPPEFAGQWRDDETGLHYNFFRYYDPDAGRFLSKDPLTFEGGFNEYAYTRNPINWIDPFGLTNASCASGERGRQKAKEDLKKAGFKIVAEEVTMKVGGARIRADFVARKNGRLYVFEVKNGSGRLTKNQEKSGAFDMKSPANQDGKISGHGGRAKTTTFEVDTDNRSAVGAKGEQKTATFGVLHYDGESGSRVE